MEVIRSGNRNSGRPLHLAWPLQVRLIEEEASYASYAEAYEINCARHGKELDAPMIKFKQLSCADSHQMADPGYKKREEVATRRQISCLHLAQGILLCNGGASFRKYCRRFPSKLVCVGGADMAQGQALKLCIWLLGGLYRVFLQRLLTWWEALLSSLPCQ